MSFARGKLRDVPACSRQIEGYANRDDDTDNDACCRQPRYPDSTSGPEALRPRLTAGLPLRWDVVNASLMGSDNRRCSTTVRLPLGREASRTSLRISPPSDETL
jgi:hypothetical protein